MILDRLLIIDDDPDVCEFLCDAGRECGFDAAATTTLDDFRREYRQFKPRVVIVDLAMPDGDGFELLRFLAGQRCESEIIVLSGYDVRVRSAAMQSGRDLGLKMVGALAKPISIDELQARLRALASYPGKVDAQDLRRALGEPDEFFLQFQPKVEMRTGHVSGVEALMRWKHPRHGMIPPSEFVPLFESAGLIGQLTRRATHAACAQLRAWGQEGIALAVAVNLSPKDLANLALPDETAELVHQHGLDPSQLVIEVTESGAMEDVGRASEILARFRLKGFRIALDDFGTGYSSLAWLHRLPFNELKIDRSFVGELGTSPEAGILVRSIVDLAHNLGLEVCAEGVETSEAWSTLAAWGCESVQGYLVSRSLSAPEIAGFIESWRLRRPAWATPGA